jgi:hypothetical protein
MGQKQLSFGISPPLHGLLQFAAKDRKVRRLWPWKQKEIAAVALGGWVSQRGGKGLDRDALVKHLPQPPEEIEPGGPPLVFDRERFEPGTGTLSFKLARSVEAAFERVCHDVGSKKGKAIAKALRSWLAANGYEAHLAELDL